MKTFAIDSASSRAGKEVEGVSAAEACPGDPLVQTLLREAPVKLLAAFSEEPVVVV